MNRNFSRNRRIVEMRREGVGPAEIARQLGVSRCVVAGVLFREGLTEHDRGRGNGATDEVKAMAVAMYLNGRPMKVIERTAGVTSGA